SWKRNNVWLPRGEWIRGGGIMTTLRRSLFCLALLLGVALLTWRPPPATAYIEAAHSLGQVVSLSTNVLVLRVESVDRTNNAVVYRKVRDLKGTHKHDLVKHRIGKAGHHPREWQGVMNWAEVGKEAVFFHNGGQAECCIGMGWYQTYAAPGGEWWQMTHGE